MGIALEWITSTGCKSLAMQLLTEPKDNKGGEIGAHCPFHSERTPGGAFSYNYEKDTGRCMSCGATGDLIKIFTVKQGLSDEEGFREFKKQYGKDADSSKLKAQSSKPKTQKPNYFHKEKVGGLYVAPDKWLERAQSFVDHSIERLMASEKALTELENRWGIDPGIALKFSFGINDQDKWVPVSSWGLPVEMKDGKEKKVWLPRGLVMPCMLHGQVRKIKIRRPDPPQKQENYLRYVEVLGGENYRYHHYKAQSPKLKAQSVVVVIETERDAALVYQECATLFDDGLVVISGGGAAKRPCDVETMALVKGAEFILSALDTDNAGVTNSQGFWVKEFGYAKYWPVPKKYGKDVGEAWKKGMDVCAWVMAGLPEWMKVKKKAEGCQERFS
jgi:hypothetical protein